MHFLKRTLLISMISTATLTAQNVAHFALNDGWHFQPAFSSAKPKADDLGQNISEDGYPTQLPNTALNALFENGVIEDPFYRTNEARLQWLEKRDWVFEKTFDAPPESRFLSGRAHVELVLRGLDTYAEVTLNGVQIIRADNMFRTWRADVRNTLRATGNVLKIYFTSPLTKEKTCIKH